MLDLRKKASLDSEGRHRESIEPRKDGSGLVVVTYNWCDRSTWYQQSERKTGHLLTVKNNLIFESGISNWIDLTHGRIYREDLVAAPYEVKIYNDGVQLAERAPFADSGGDFVVDYRTGEVTFAEMPSGPVTADFSHENGSLFTIKPSEGKRLWIEDSEVQFSTDIDIKDTIHFQAFAYNPQGPPVPKIPVSLPTTYKTAGDFVDEARGAYPQVPAFGGNSGRGLSQPHLVFPFKYLQLKELFYSYGLEIRVWLENDNEFGGERATATFYCSSHSES